MGLISSVVESGLSYGSVSEGGMIRHVVINVVVRGGRYLTVRLACSVVSVVALIFSSV